MNTKTILIDLDGVIVDFVTAAFEVFGVYAGHFDYPTEAGFDVLAALNKLREFDNAGKPISSNEFWNGTLAIESWWRSLNPYPGAIDFVNDLCNIGDVYLATSPTLAPQCASGKMLWIQDRLPKLGRKFMIGSAKELMARPDSILVDDREANCQKFVVAGGQAVLVPRPWNYYKSAGPGCDYCPHTYDTLYKQIAMRCGQ